VNLLLALIGCDRRDEPTDEGTPPPICSEVNHTQVSAGLGTSVTSPGCGSLALGDFQVLGEGTFTIDLFSDGERVIPHVVAETGGVFRGLHMTGTFTLDGTDPVRLWRQAFASGSSAIEELPESILLGEDGVPILADEPPGTSAWAGLIGRHDGASAVVGVHSAVLTRFSAAFEADGTVHAVWGGQGEELPLTAGNELFLDPLFLAMGRDPNELWQTWIAAVADNATIAPPAPPEPAIMIALESALSASYVNDVLVQAAAWNDAHPADAGPNVALIEGWQGGPSTTSELITAIRSIGFVPALRLTPFVAAPEDDAVALHPEWWMKDPVGAPLLHEGFVVMDVTQVDAAAAVGAFIEDLATEGWKVFVLDHLDGAAVEGARSDSTTGTLAYRSALELVRASAPGVRIVGVDAPFLPSSGLLDGFRIDPWAQELPGRVFTDGVWWAIDSGRIPQDENVSPNPLTGEVVAATLSGGSWGVPQYTYEDSVLTLLLDLGPLGAAGAVPLDPLSTLGAPARWTFGTGEIALVNWYGVPATITGPGGTEVLSGVTAEPGDRLLEPLAGEIWIPNED